MSKLYSELKISHFLQGVVDVVLHDGTKYKGKIGVDYLNDDWEEDGEREAMLLDLADGSMVVICFEDIKSIGFAEQAIPISSSKNKASAQPVKIATA